EHQVLGDGVAADQLDDDVHVLRAGDLEGVAEHPRLLADLLARDLDRLVGDLGDLDGAAGAALDLVGVAIQDVPGAAAHGTDAEQPHPDRFHAAPRRSPSFLNMSLMPRTAWRRRCSFSISAMRTWSSPYSPKPTPGATAIFACSISRWAKAIEPSLA